MNAVMFIIALSVIACISFVAGLMWSLFMPGTGLLVGVATFVVLVAMTSVKS